jgi:hypothetical protein
LKSAQHSVRPPRGVSRVHRTPARGCATIAPAMRDTTAPTPPVPGEDLHAGLDAGWLLPAPAPREAVHTRSILCRSFRRDDGLFDIDGRFVDTRPFAYDSEFRGHCPAGSALHHMQLRLTIDRTRHIRALHTAMPGTPYAGCGEVQANFQRLVGCSIGRGFKRTVAERLGGVEGCTHVRALLEAMAAAAVQCFASARYAPHAPGHEEPVRVFRLDTLLDTCHSYREGSPVLQRLRERLK